MTQQAAILDNRYWLMERVPLDLLEEWKEERNLEPDGRAENIHAEDTWPPIVIYRKREDQ